MTPKIKEHTCLICNGTGFPPSMKSAHPGRKIYPVKCTSCQGKGKIPETGRGGLSALVSRPRR